MSVPLIADSEVRNGNLFDESDPARKEKCNDDGKNKSCKVSFGF